MKISDIRLIIKQNKFFFATYKKFTSADYKKAFKEYLHGCSKSKKKVRRELALIREYWECDPMHYYRYRLFAKDLSDDELLDYVPPFYFYNIYMQNIYKGVNISSFNSKIFLNKLFKEKGIKTPKVVAVIKKGIIYDSENKLISFHSLSEV